MVPWMAGKISKEREKETDRNICYGTVTCKVLLNWPHSKLVQYLTEL